MGDYRLQLALTLLVGMSGSGKSTFAFRQLLNTPAACRFIFDDMGRAATRLGEAIGVRPSWTASELEAALATRWVLFNPHRMFPGDTKAAFKFFCQWVYDVSCRAPGVKLVLADEIWQWQDRDAIPKELALMVQAGREENIHFICATQRPDEVNPSITGQCTELVAFHTDESRGLRRIADLGLDAEAVKALPMGQYLSLDRLSGKIASGKVF